VADAGDGGREGVNRFIGLGKRRTRAG
jgi:hypothetical protein